MTFRDWFNKNLLDEAKGIAENGADCGFPHISYTTECCEIYDRFASEIWDMAVKDADDMGFKNVAEMIARFSRSDMLMDWNMFRNLMLWYACEKVSVEIINELDKEEE